MKRVKGNGVEDVDKENVWVYRGRGEHKAFLYEIVANKISGKSDGYTNLGSALL